MPPEALSGKILARDIQMLPWPPLGSQDFEGEKPLDCCDACDNGQRHATNICPTLVVHMPSVEFAQGAYLQEFSRCIQEIPKSPIDPD